MRALLSFTGIAIPVTAIGRSILGAFALSPSGLPTQHTNSQRYRRKVKPRVYTIHQVSQDCLHCTMSKTIDFVFPVSF